jgi:hypothetical protein
MCASARSSRGQSCGHDSRRLSLTGRKDLAARPKELTQSPGPSLASADPGGRTVSPHGLKCRHEDWPRPLEPARRKRNHGVSRCERRPNVSLIWLATQIGQAGLGPWIAKPKRTRSVALNPSSRPTQLSAVLAPSRPSASRRSPMPIPEDSGGPSSYGSRALTALARGARLQLRSGRRDGRRGRTKGCSIPPAERKPFHLTRTSPCERGCRRSERSLFGQRRPRCAAGSSLPAVKPISRSQWNAGFGPDSGPSRGAPCRHSFRP